MSLQEQYKIIEVRRLSGIFLNALESTGGNVKDSIQMTELNPKTEIGKEAYEMGLSEYNSNAATFDFLGAKIEARAIGGRVVFSSNFHKIADRFNNALLRFDLGYAIKIEDFQIIEKLEELGFLPN